MGIKITKSAERGKADYGWLKTRYSFSFADYFNPVRERFGVLRVLNDDTISGGGGFDMHPHSNMEIITIPLHGALQHRDNMGHTSVIRKNEVQYMSAGTGVYHAEYNDSVSEELRLLQLWIFPKTRNTEPRYAQIDLTGKIGKNEVTNFVSPNGGSGIIGINQNAWLSLLHSEAGKQYIYTPYLPGNYVFMFVIEGEFETARHRVARRDSAEITEAQKIEFTTLAESEILIIEIPAN